MYYNSSVEILYLLKLLKVRIQIDQPCSITSVVYIFPVFTPLELYIALHVVFSRQESQFSVRCRKTSFLLNLYLSYALHRQHTFKKPMIKNKYLTKWQSLGVKDLCVMEPSFSFTQCLTSHTPEKKDIFQR